MKGRLNSTVWMVIGINAAALVGVLALAYNAGSNAHNVATAGSFPMTLVGAGILAVVASFVFVSLLMIFAADHFGRLARRLEDEEQLRQLAVQELAHRLKNKIATIQAIISVQLRDQPQLRRDILDRLGALTAADRLIEAAARRGRILQVGHLERFNPAVLELERAGRTR